MLAPARTGSVNQSAYQVALHDLVLRVQCPVPTILAGIETRLAQLPAAPDAKADLTIAYDFDRSCHSRPGDGRVVYESPHATAVYSPSEDALYAFHDAGPTMRCAPAAGHAEICGSSDGSQNWVLTRPLLTLAVMELARRRGLHPLHAACLARSGAGVLVCGPSGSGKSTLTVALLEAGLDFLGDDLVFIQPAPRGVRALGFPDELGLAADVREIFPDLAAEIDASPPSGWPKARADIDVLAPTTRVLRSCVPLLILVLSEGADRTAIEALDADTALLELMPSILLTEPDTCAAHLAALASLTSSATIRRTAARPDLAAVTRFVDRTLPHPHESEDHRA